MDITYSIKGDIEVQRRLQTMGDRVRNAVAAAIFEMTETAKAIAQSRAPRGKTGKLQQGIISWVQGDELSIPNNGNAITNVQMDRYRAFMKDRSSVIGFVASTWYTGRFFERGVDKAKTWVGPRTRTKAYNAYEASLKRSIRGNMRRNAPGPITQADHDRYVARAMKVGDRAGRKEAEKFKRQGFYRHQRLPARPFMGPARQAISTIFESTIQAAVDKAVRDGR
jgi:hypothetical protein